jgi:transcriptional regulator with XRE-family HTH domain
MNDWQRWLDHATGGASAREVAKRVGVSHVTVGRWMNADTAPVPGILRISRAYAADPIDGMIAAGWLTGADLLEGGLRNAVRHAPTSFLTEELHERVESGRLEGNFDELREIFRNRD